MKKTFSIIKIGYTTGIYGCSGEYFALILPKDVYYFEGMYGTDERVARHLKDNGYMDRYIQSVYGKLTRSDIPKKRFHDENEMLNVLKTFKHIKKIDNR